MSTQDPTPAELGWDTRSTTVLEDGLVPARVACGHRDVWTLFGAGPPLLAKVTGRMRHEARGRPSDLPAVGDWVALDPVNKIIHAVLERRTALGRTDPHTGSREVLAANVDIVFVVTSANRELNARRLERFVALGLSGGAECVVLLNKCDLVDDVTPALGEVRAAVGGDAPIVVCSALQGVGLEIVSSYLVPGKTVALLGTSGVGKSTLANALLGADVQATAAIRAMDDRGRHTTVRRELLVLPTGALLIDTPGLKLPRVGAGDGAGIAEVFADIDLLSAECRYSDCAHAGEPGCAVTAAVAEGRLDPLRLEAMVRLASERWAEERLTPRGRAAARRR